MSVQQFQLSRFDKVIIGGTEYQPIDTTGPVLQFLRLDGTGTVEHFGHAELATFRARSDWRYVRNWFRPAGVRDERIRPNEAEVSALNPDHQDRLAWQHNLVTVLHELRHSSGLALSNIGVDNHRSVIAERVNAREIARQQIGIAPRAGRKVVIRQLPSTRTILRIYRQYSRAGYRMEALIPSSHAPRVPTQVDHEAEELLRDCILNYASPQRPSKTEVFQNTSTRFEAENLRRRECGLRELKTYSRRTIDRRIDRLDPFFVACHRHGPDAARSRFATSGAGLPKLYPMQRIELDEWRVDVRTWFGRLGISERLPPEVRDSLPGGRRWVCVAIDVATRCILGLRIAEAPSSSEAVRLLRQVVQDKTELAKAVGAQSNWPFYGGLGEVAADGGSAFQSTEFIAAVTDLQGNIHFPPIGIPELRATIERFFGTAATQLMPLLSGRTFRSPEERGDYDSKARAVLDDEDLVRILIKWIVDDYHHAPHIGLGGSSPAERWKELASERFVPEPPDTHTRRTALGVEVERTLTKQGIQVATNFYSCPELRDRFRHSRQRKFRVRIDPDDIGAVSVLIDRAWVDAPCVQGDVHGVTLDAWRLQLALINQRYRDQAALSRSIREETIASIRATNAQRVAQLLPGSLSVTQEQIDALERTDFTGKSWQPSISDDPVATRSQEGTLIFPSVMPSTIPVLEQSDNAISPAVPNARWSMEND